MIPRFAAPGISFKNRHDYLFLGRETGLKSERVEFTATRNVMTVFEAYARHEV